MGGLRYHGQHIYQLGRPYKKRKMLFRQLVTHLSQHQRITTTLAQARAIRPLAERVMVVARRLSLNKQDNLSRNFLLKHLDTDLALKKTVMEISSRFKDKINNFTRIVPLSKRRLGDNAQMAYIEYVGNEMEKFEAAQRKEDIQKGLIVEPQTWGTQIFKQERDFFTKKLTETEELLKLSSIDLQEAFLKGKIQKEVMDQKLNALKIQLDFFQAKLKRVEHDLYIATKNKYDLQKFYVY